MIQNEVGNLNTPREERKIISEHAARLNSVYIDSFIYTYKEQNSPEHRKIWKASQFLLGGVTLT